MVNLPNRWLTVGRRRFDLSRRTLIMGVINITPDSFSDGGRFFSLEAALTQARHLIAAGADLLDVGGESTRPFSEPVPLAEELDRVVPVIEAIRRESDIPISIDTYKAAVAEAALAAGADLINDISACRFDPDMAPLAAKAGVPLIIMHMQGTPRDMQLDPRYEDVVGEVKAFLAARRDYAISCGVAQDRLILDVGIGFGKNLDHNLELLRRHQEFQELSCPLLLGVSRKAFIGKITNLPPQERDIASLGAIAYGALHGADIIRTHNAALAAQVLAVINAIRWGYPNV